LCCDRLFQFCSLAIDVLLLELFSVLLSDLGSFFDDSKYSAHSFLEFENSEFSCVLVVIFKLDDFIGKKDIFLSYTNIPQLMKVFSAFDSQFVGKPRSSISYDLILFGEGSHF